MNIGQVTGHAKIDAHYPKEPVSVGQPQERQVEKTLGQKGNSHYGDYQSQKTVDDEMMKQSLDQANKTLNSVDRYIEREVHEKTGAVMYKLKDRQTGEVIAEFPPKKIQDMIAKMWELAGLFVDEKA